MAEKKLITSGYRGIKFTSWMQFVLIAVSAITFSVLCTFIRVRLDLTEDHRYTLSAPTHKILSKIKNDLFIQVYLEGDMEIPFRRLRRSVKDLLDEFRIASGKRIDYEFINPFAAKDIKARDNLYKALVDKGLIPVDIKAKDSEGGTSQKRVFPGMLMNYNGIEIPVNFLSNNTYNSPEQNLLHSMEGLEYQMIQTISTLCSDTVYKVAFIEGHGEMPEIEVADLTISLARFFTIDRGSIRGKQGILDRYSAIVIAGPEKAFDDKDKLAIDQYIMNGGKVLWLLEEVKVREDSLINGETVALYRPLNIEDQLFKYGVRINPGIIQDLDCFLLPVKVETGASQQQIVPMPWIYYPLLHPASSNPVTRNLNKVLGRFVNYIDTVGENPEIKKVTLLTTSNACRIVRPPLLISLKEIDTPPERKQFDKSWLPVAVLLQGKFQSAFKNRLVTELVEDKSFRVREESKPTRMIFVADADIIRNGVRHQGAALVPLPLGQDQSTGGTFGNKDFVVNCLNYLVDETGIMELRSRELKLRMLDKASVRENKLMIQTINTALPPILVILAGIAYNFFRRRKYSGY